MSLVAGTRLGPYEIQSAIGAGGMGEVYKARDTRLDRTIAIKVLPAELSADPDRRARFEREARAVAALNHPHICTLHDIGTHDGTTFLVMEHLPGQTLADRLLKGPLPLPQALDIAAQIADALDAAHKHGIIHRDLKPGNVMLTSGGAGRSGVTSAKLLDFGLAKLARHGERPALASETHAVTEAAPVTARGTILGTLQYMAPEQLEGQEADARTDLWALGAILYEMLTGKRAFAGDSQVSLIGNIMNAEPTALSTLHPLTPPALDRVVKKCLAKHPDDRWDSAHDLADELRWVSQSSGVPVLTGESASRRLRTLRRALLLVGILGAAVVGAVATWLTLTATATVRGTTDASMPASSRFAIDLPDGLQLIGTPPTVSPDGRRLAFSALGQGGIRVYIRDLDSFAVREVRGSADGVAPFFSPDGQWVGFLAGTLVKKAPATGGEASTLPSPSVGLTKAAWPASGLIVVSGYDGKLWGVSSEAGLGGMRADPLPIDPGLGKLSRPVALPDGRVLFTIARSGDASIGVYDPGQRRGYRLGPSGSPVAYLPTGQLVFFRGNQLMSAPFELAKTALAASASPVLSEVEQDFVAFSGTGLVTLLHYPLGIRRTIVAVDRSGAYAQLIRESESFRWPRVSHDGRRLAVGRRASQSRGAKVWVFDLEAGGHIQLHDDGTNTEPVWTPDGKRIIYSSIRGSDVDLYWQPADGSGKSEVLSSLPFEEWPSAVSPDGRLVALYGQSKANEYGIWTVTLDGAAKAAQILRSPSDVRGARFAPSGRWIAYSSDETGRSEVYVCPFPGLNAKWAVSTDGGTSPVWSPNGRELFYRSGPRMMVAEVTTSPTFSTRPARVLFEGRFDLDLYGDIDYDVMPDGQHFVMMLVEPAAQPRLRVMTNWVPEGAKR